MMQLVMLTCSGQLTRKDDGSASPFYVFVSRDPLSCNRDSDEWWWLSANSTRDKSGRDKPTRPNCLFFAAGQEDRRHRTLTLRLKKACWMLGVRAHLIIKAIPYIECQLGDTEFPWT